jgi:excisionase family DNA binding protein
MAINLLTPEQVGEILGRPSSWVTTAARSGVIPGRKVGSRWRFLESDVVEYLDTVRTGGSKATPVRRKRPAA